MGLGTYFRPYRNKVLLIWRFPVSRRQYVDAWSQAIADGSVTQCERAPASVSGDLDAIAVVLTLTRTLTRGPHSNDRKRQINPVLFT